jgi:hypothetical protein
VADAPGLELAADDSVAAGAGEAVEAGDLAAEDCAATRLREVVGVVDAATE